MTMHLQLEHYNALTNYFTTLLLRHVIQIVVLHAVLKPPFCSVLVAQRPPTGYHCFHEKRGVENRRQMDI